MRNRIHVFKERTRNRSPDEILRELEKMTNTLNQDKMLADELTMDGVLSKALSQALLAHKPKEKNYE